MHVSSPRLTAEARPAPLTPASPSPQEPRDYLVVALLLYLAIWIGFAAAVWLLLLPE